MQAEAEIPVTTWRFTLMLLLLFFLVSELFAFGKKKSVVVLGGNPRERSGELKKFLGRNFRREMK